jgi:hypothetical protein
MYHVASPSTWNGTRGNGISMRWGAPVQVSVSKYVGTVFGGSTRAVRGSIFQTYPFASKYSGSGPAYTGVPTASTHSGPALIPSAPGAPAGPSGPCGPGSPCAPAGPVAPVAPVAPGAPSAPSTPSAPAGPAGPRHPAATARAATTIVRMFPPNERRVAGGGARGRLEVDRQASAVVRGPIRSDVDRCCRLLTGSAPC